MPAVLTKNGDALELDLSGCRGSEFTDAKEKVQEISGRRFDWDRKLWIVPAEPFVAERILKTIRPQAEDSLHDWVREERTSQSEQLATPLPEDASLLIPWATERCGWQPEVVNDEEFTGLFPWQRAAVAVLAENCRAILADDMGLGKTLQAISAVTESLLRCSYEAAALIALGRAESGTPSRALSGILETLEGEACCSDPKRQKEALQRLWSRVASASDGARSCAREEALCSWTDKQDAAPAWVRVLEGGDYLRDKEVRRALPKLSPHAALSLGPKLIVAPSSVKGSWEREIRRWLPPETPVHIINGSSPTARHNKLVKAIEENAWVIVNWEQLRIKKEKKKLRNGGTKTVTVMKEPLFETAPWVAEVADEVHRAKNRKSQQTQGLWRVQAPIMIGASGTPLMNAPDELWAILRWLWPDEYNSNGTADRPKTAYWAFYNDFVEFWEDTYGRRVVTGVKNPDALRFALKGKLIRRTAALLGLKGRKRIRYDVPLNTKQQKLYDAAEKDMWLAVEKAMDEGDESARQFAKAALEGAELGTLYRIPNGGARMVRLQQIIETPALLGGEDDSALMDDFMEKFEDSRPAQWVVGCKFKKSCEILAARLRAAKAEVGLYTGDVDPKDRTELEDRFQHGDVDVIIGTMDALREGITLTSGHLMYQMTRGVVPAHNEQLESRCDRLGQQELVRVYIPLAENTVATGRVEPINRVKEKIVSSVLPKDTIQEEHE